MSLDKKLKFERLLNEEQVEELLCYTSQKLHLRITYHLRTIKHVGTIYPEADPSKFEKKYDGKLITGNIIGSYITEFRTNISSERYQEIIYNPPKILEFQDPDWPENYYKFVDELNNTMREYLKKIKLI